MKRYNNIYEKIFDYENLVKAHHNARKGKNFYNEVKKVNENEDYYLIQIQNMLIWKTYKTSNYEIFTIFDKGKEREIYKLPYFPDRIVHWAIMQQIEPIFTNTFSSFSCAALRDKGIHHGLDLLSEYMKDKNGTKYCLKLDVKKFFPNINHAMLKNLLRRKFKDKELLWLLDEIIDSVEGEAGVPIGNYLSQYFANFYLTYFDHWLKEQMKVKYVIRYMDDVVILHNDKDYLHKLRCQIENYLSENLKLELKHNWQVFPSRVRGIDFLGYRHFGKYILLRKSTCKNLKHKMRKISRQATEIHSLSYSQQCTINSYLGWLKWCNSHNLFNKYFKDVMQYENKRNGRHNKTIRDNPHNCVCQKQYNKN